jgi:hypothetical protein
MDLRAYFIERCEAARARGLEIRPDAFNVIPFAPPEYCCPKHECYWAVAAFEKCVCPVGAALLDTSAQGFYGEDDSTESTFIARQLGVEDVWVGALINGFDGIPLVKARKWQRSTRDTVSLIDAGYELGRELRERYVV